MSNNYYNQEQLCFSELDNGNIEVRLSTILLVQFIPVFFDLLVIGTKVAENMSAGTVESSKSAMDLQIPFDGEIVSVNKALAEQPDLASSKNNGENWIYVIKPNSANWRDALMSEEEFKAFMQP